MLTGANNANRIGFPISQLKKRWSPVVTKWNVLIMSYNAVFSTSIQKLLGLIPDVHSITRRFPVLFFLWWQPLFNLSIERKSLHWRDCPDYEGPTLTSPSKQKKPPCILFHFVSRKISLEARDRQQNTNKKNINTHKPAGCYLFTENSYPIIEYVGNV